MNKMMYNFENKIPEFGKKPRTDKKKLAELLLLTTA